MLKLSVLGAPRREDPCTANGSMQSRKDRSTLVARAAEAAAWRGAGRTRRKGRRTSAGWLRFSIGLTF